MFSLVDPEAYSASQASLSNDKMHGRALRSGENKDMS